MFKLPKIFAKLQLSALTWKYFRTLMLVMKMVISQIIVLYIHICTAQSLSPLLCLWLSSTWTCPACLTLPPHLLVNNQPSCQTFLIQLKWWLSKNVSDRYLLCMFLIRKACCLKMLLFWEINQTQFHQRHYTFKYHSSLHQS